MIGTSPVAKTIHPKPSATHVLGSLLIALAIAGCSGAKLASAPAVSSRPAARPTIVYVADFELAADSVQSQTLRSALPVHAYIEQQKARSLVAEMSGLIVDDLNGRGITATRLPAKTPVPQQGWLVRGVVMKIDEGNRVARAVAGFGAGQTDLQVATATDELSAATTPAPLYEAQTDAAGNTLPGAVVRLNPYVVAAKFVLDGQDLDRSTHATAEKIADEIAARLKGTRQGAQPARNTAS